ncbi:MAG: ribosome maturation factor RimP [Deltaproteobacteria bacterium]|nr:ribosome maturation factor RimP [Deltaproteobacteria bacterium]
MELVEVEYRRESHGWVLRLFMDQPSGVSVDDCARMSDVVGDLLDVADIIPNPYHLEISSPGLNRPLRRLEHFQEQVGKIIEARTLEPIEGRRRFTGVLREAAGATITVECDGKGYEIPISRVERARLRYFESGGK